MQFKFTLLRIPLYLILFLLIGCKKKNSPDYSIETLVNPHGIAPLTALFKIRSNETFKVSFKILGDNPIEKKFSESSKELDMPVLGLYPGTTNIVVVGLSFENYRTIDTIKVETKPCPSFFPEIKINKLDRANMEKGLHGCDIHYANNGKFHSIPMIFDDKGIVRWYLDLSSYGKMISPFQKVSNGNLLMVDRHNIYEFSMLGKLLKQSTINSNYGMHHEVLELPNSDLLICVGKRNEFIDLNGKRVKSDSDFIIHYDTKESKIIKEWDLATNLDVGRSDLNFLREGDWLHMNGLAFNSQDSSIVVSGRNQGLIKISWNNNLKWILAPKKNWNRSGRLHKGYRLEPFLLTAVDSKGNVLDEDIQNGILSTDIFDFTWGTHAPELLPSGNLIAFDNGFYRNFGKGKPYSRAVEYKIDEDNKTVEQIWQYGRDRGIKFYSAIASDVDFLSLKNNILITSGFIGRSSNFSSKIVEVDYKTGHEVFEATLYLKTVNGNKTRSWGQIDLLYRSERMELY